MGFSFSLAGEFVIVYWMYVDEREEERWIGWMEGDRHGERKGGPDKVASDVTSHHMIPADPKLGCGTIPKDFVLL